MANNPNRGGGITVNATPDPEAFLRTWSRVSGAVDSLKANLRAVGTGAARALGGMARAVGDVLARLMRVSGVVRGLEEGVKRLGQWGQAAGRELSYALNRLSADALYLKNALGAMAAPLLTAVAPAVDQLTDRFVGLFNIINQVLARLSGATTYTVARRNAAAWSAVSNAVSNAATAVNRYLAGFDELNVLTGKASGGGGGGGGGGAGGGLMFETMEIDGGLAAFVDQLKAAFDAADWETLGTLLGEKLNALVAGVDWTALGERLGFGLDGAIRTAGAMLEATDFETIGARIAGFLNGALSQIDFSAAGATAARLFTSLAETLAGFVEDLDWGGLAGKAAEAVNGFAAELGRKLDAIDWPGLALKLTAGLNGFIRETDWAALGRTLAGRINDLLAILATAAANYDWAGAGAALAGAMNRLFRSVDWDALGEWLNSTLLGVLDFGLAVAEGFDAGGFAEGIGRALGRVDWNAVAGKLWALLSAALQKLGEAFGTLLFGGSADLGVNIELLKRGWETLTAWLGIDSPLSALIALARQGWSTIAAFVGTAVTVLTILGKKGWSTIAAYVGTAVKVLTSLGKKNWTSIAKFVGTAVTVATALKKKGWSSITKFVTGNSGGTVGIKLTLSSVASALRSAASKLGIHLATGGVVTAAGNLRRFAAGGMIAPGGRASWWDGVRKYAGGTLRAHGTVFVAGESGPEIMGHVNGRTEILNKSQLAQAIYGAVAAGMGPAVNALGGYLGNRMAECANAVIAAVSGVEYRAPAMATGNVMPYAVSERSIQATEALQAALEANNEDLIQTIISAVGAQTVALVAALGGIRNGGAEARPLNARALVDQINRQTRMYGSSPLLGN